MSTQPTVFTPRENRTATFFATCGLFASLWACGWFATVAIAQENADEPVASGQTFDQESITLRTALHHDPTLASPLERLVTLYQTAGKLPDLIGLYRTHVGQYPNDPSGRTVLVRLLVATGDPAGLTSTEAAVAQFPENSTLHHLLYLLLSARNDPKAINELDKAIDTETRPAKKLKWIEDLLPLAQVTDRRDLAVKHFTAVAEIHRNAEQRLEVARLMNRFKYFDLSLKLLTKPNDNSVSPPAPETMVDLELEAATSEVGLGQSELASARLEKLLGRLTGDYWRRPDIMRRRLALVASPVERDAIIASARKRTIDNPRDEAAVLDLAQTLAALQFRREALESLIKAGEQFSNSEIIEQRTLELFDRLRDERGRDEYLQARVKLHPKRADLVLMRVKSQYLLGRRTEADAMFEELIKPMTGKLQAEQVLEMARFLRRSSLADESADLLERVIRLNPNRLDVRRELAEVRLALGQRHRISEAFANAVSADAAIEDVLDLVQFMLEQKLYLEASELLRERLKDNQSNLELRLLLVNVERRMGRVTTGTRVIDECRELADTGARYRAWLEAAVAFFDELESVGEFLGAEQKRLDAELGEWNERQLERRLAFADVASSNGAEAEAAALLQTDLAGELPAPMKLAIRRMLIELLKNDTNRRELLAQELQSLAQEDPQSIAEYSARLALLHKSQEREDLAIQFLQKVDAGQIRDPALLNSLLTAFQDRTDHTPLLVAIVERLTVINPSDRANWERWLTVLAAGGDEDRLRVEIRRLLTGMKELTLDEPTRQLLELYIADSYWRSISGQLGDGRSAHAGQLAEVLPHLDAIERMARDDQQWLWMTWIRAHVLNKLGRTEARDEAIAELERVLATLTVFPVQSHLKPTEPRIVFPDGVSISTERARLLLREPPPAEAPFELTEANALVPDFKVRWSWKSNGSGISAIKPVGRRYVLIGENSGAVSCIDAINGKLLWTRDGLLPVWLVDPDDAQSPFSSINVPQLDRSGFAILPLRESDDVPEPDRFCVSGLSSVSCYSLKDGKLQWRADVGPRARKPGADPVNSDMNPAAVSVFAINDQRNLLTWEPRHSTLANVDPKTGKVLWYRIVSVVGGPATTVGSAHALLSGASLHGRHLLVYGPLTAVIDIGDGEVVWSFDPHSLRSFPVPLDERTSASAGQTSGSQPPANSQWTAFPNLVDLSLNLGNNPWQFNRHVPLSLTGAAVKFAGYAQQGMESYAELHGSRLLLFQENAVQIVDLDLPLTTQSATAAGFVFGVNGRVASSLGLYGAVTFTDLKTTRVKNHDVSDLLPPEGQSMTVPIQATTDGLLAYVSGQRGIQCLNTISGQLVYQVPWPKSVEPKVAMIAPQQSNGGGGSRYSNFGQTIDSGANRHPTENCSLACIHNGILYTLTADKTVVALEGASVDGR